MKKTTRWGLIIGVVCRAEVVGVILIGAVGLTSILHLDRRGDAQILAAVGMR